MFLTLTLTACNGQEKDNNKDLAIEKEANEENKQDLPKGEWQVHKELDDNGNIISYDSIYSWSSSGNYDDITRMNIDSLMRSHRAFISKRFSAIKNQDFPYLFNQDSLFSKGFFEEDLFMRQFGEDFPEIDEINKKMERMQQDMLQEFFPKEHSEKNK